MMTTLLEWLYPPRCVWCHSFLIKGEEQDVCRLCLDQYEIEKQLVQKDVVVPSLIEELKGCEIEEIVNHLALVPYTQSYRKALMRWKYKGIRQYGRVFARLIVEEGLVEQLGEVDCLIPVPLAPSRQRKRGFNQALDLAREVGKLEQIIVWDCLERNRDTKPQAACTREMRHTNVLGSIQMKVQEEKVNLPVNHVVIIDDIYTTGSTAKECIKVLKKQYLFRNTQFDMITVGKGEF